MNRRLKIGALRRIQVALHDTRPPMTRLLQDCTHSDGSVQPAYEQQFKTLFKAQRLGYIDSRGFITNKGRNFVAERPT